MCAEPDATVEARGSVGGQCSGVGEWENAERNLGLAQQIDPNSAEVVEAFALVDQSTGENALAEAQFEAALQVVPSLSRARNNYAAFLYSQGRFVEAEREFKRVTGDPLYSGSPLAFVNLGLSLLPSGEKKESAAAFTLAFSKDRPLSVAAL